MTCLLARYYFDNRTLFGSGLSILDSHEILTSHLTPWHCSWTSLSAPRAHLEQPPGMIAALALIEMWAVLRVGRRERCSRKKLQKARNSISQEECVQERQLHGWRWTLPEQLALLSCHLHTVKGQNHCQALHGPNPATTQGEKAEGSTRGWVTWHSPQCTSVQINLRTIGIVKHKTQGFFLDINQLPRWWG